MNNACSPRQESLPPKKKEGRTNLDSLFRDRGSSSHVRRSVSLTSRSHVGKPDELVGDLFRRTDPISQAKYVAVQDPSPQALSAVETRAPTIHEFVALVFADPPPLPPAPLPPLPSGGRGTDAVGGRGTPVPTSIESQHRREQVTCPEVTLRGRKSQRKHKAEGGSPT